MKNMGNLFKHLINIILGSFDYQIMSKDKWRPKYDFEYLNIPHDVKHKIKNNTMLNEAGLINIVSVSEYLLGYGIQGDFIECGVWKGGSVALMAHVLKTNNEFRNIYLFDCFDDICQPDILIDGDRAIRAVGGSEFAKGELIPVKGIYNKLGGSGNEEKVKALIVDDLGYPSNLIHIHKGWFQDTLPQIRNSIDQVALLRLDGDWYSSTKVCLENLYDKVVKGGVIIVDDYGCYEGCKKAVDEFISEISITPFLFKVNNDCVFWIKE